MNRLLLVVSLVPLLAEAASPRACVGSLPVGSFRLTVAPAKGGPPLAVRTVNAIRAGQKLKYAPVRLPPETKDRAQIAIVLAPPAGKGAGEFTIFDPVKAGAPAEWSAPRDTSVVAVVFGPQGLSVKKLKTLMDKNQEVLAELADYAEQNAKVEGLIEALAASEQSGGGLDAAIVGFSAKYNVAMPKLDTKAATDRQATVLLQALLPAVNTYNPLAPRQAVMQQSAGLAASVAGMFFGTPVGLAAGGAALLQNMRTLMFPGVEFRTAFTQGTDDGLALCAKRQDAGKSRTRLAYLWAYRLPNLDRPAVALAGDAHVPLGAKSLLRLKGAANLKSLEHVREWQLQPAGTGSPVTVPITVQAAGPALELDLTKVKAAPGEYRLAARWDWDTISIPANVWLHPFGDLKAAKLTARSRGRLAEGSGIVPVTLEGADFQFVEKVTLERADNRQGSPAELPFTLPKGRRGGAQQTIETGLDTKTCGRGHYRLLLAQGDGLTYEVPFQILYPNPKISNLPLRVNTGEKTQRLGLEGSGLDRIADITSEGGRFELEPASGESRRTVLFHLAPGAARGNRFAARMRVEGIDEAVDLPAAVAVAGPRPRIASVRKSLPEDTIVALLAEEVPSGSTASFALSVQNLEGIPTVEISCAGDEHLRQKMVLAPGDRTSGAKLDVAGEGMLFLSLDPGVIGQPGCHFTATLTTGPAGRSDPYPLGQVVRLPRIAQFALTDDKIGEGLYAGTLKGQDLETIEKVGWEAASGTPVEAIPTPAPGEPGKQILKIALPWPAPAPHAQVFVWLRGEPHGRATEARY